MRGRSLVLSLPENPVGDDYMLFIEEKIKLHMLIGSSDIYTTRRGRCDERDSVHREKELCHSRNRDSESDERKPLAEDGKPQMKEMTEQNYVRYRDAEEIRMAHDLAKDISELEREYMEKEMRDIEDEHGYEGRYRIDIDDKTSLDSRTYLRDDDR